MLAQRFITVLAVRNFLLNMVKVFFISCFPFKLTISMLHLFLVQLISEFFPALLGFLHELDVSFLFGSDFAIDSLLNHYHVAAIGHLVDALKFFSFTMS